MKMFKDTDVEQLSEENRGDATYIKPNAGTRIIFPMWQCPRCGTRTWLTNQNRRKRHLDAKKRKDALYVTTERFEIL